MRFTAVSAALCLATVVKAGTTLWSGSFNNYASYADFDKWSWANQVGAYQWYIHGSSATSSYLNTSPSYKNPASSETRGLKLTIDSSSHWNGQTFQRTEIIPQTTANLGSGHLYYHFSVKRSNTNAPDSSVEHQVVFFESHFTELKYGVNGNTNLHWFVSGSSKWSTAFTADTWYNFAYDIDFSAKTVGLWASTGSSPLTKVVNNISASTSTNSADWHLGVLAFGSKTEDWYFSGVYIESGSINTSIGSGVAPSSSEPATPTTVDPTPSEPSSTAPSKPQQTNWGQCGGEGWTGPTECTPPATCVGVSVPYYYQCKP